LVTPNRVVALLAVLGAASGTGGAAVGRAGHAGSASSPRQMLAFMTTLSPAACRRMIPRLKRLCPPRPISHGSYDTEILVADVDRDGKADVLIRYRSLFDCGTQGCTTELYRSVRGRYVPVFLNLVSDGGVSLCRAGERPGLIFGDAHHCFPIDGQR
jgi:hypothetical protein